MVVRGGEVFSSEGDWTPNRLVIIRFPSVDLAKKWWHSEEYAQAKLQKEKAAKSNLVIVEGI